MDMIPHSRSIPGETRLGFDSAMAASSATDTAPTSRVSSTGFSSSDARGGSPSFEVRDMLYAESYFLPRLAVLDWRLTRDSLQQTGGRHRLFTYSARGKDIVTKRD
jgi:hypothetical protein